MTIADLEKIFKDKGLLEQAFIHRSYLNESEEFSESNERLEFLGDSVLQVLTSTYLYHKFPESAEGQLTNLRSAVVRTTTLAAVARQLNLGPVLKMSKGEEDSGGRQNDSLLANTFEAILGALYLDSGIPVANRFLEEILFPKIEEIVRENIIFDYKSLVQETAQKKYKKSPSYQILTASGPDHDRLFTVGLFLRKEKIGEGTGKNKQAAEQAAAKSALEKLTPTM